MSFMRLFYFFLAGGGGMVVVFKLLDFFFPLKSFSLIWDKIMLDGISEVISNICTNLDLL